MARLDDFANGTTTIGGRMVLVWEDADLPEITASAQLGLPTASSDPDTTLRLGIDMAWTFDPVILTAGIGGSSAFEAGDPQLDASFGMLFGINDRIAFGTEVQWVTDPGNAGDPLADAISLSTKLSVTAGRNVFEPSITLGLTEATPDVTLGFAWSRRF